MARILVVDDNPYICEELSDILADEGHSVVAVQSGTEALKLKEDFDIVLTDLVMPEVDGIDVLTHFKKNNPKTQVIVITAFGTIESAVEAMKKGASGYISKPFKIEELRASVNIALEEVRFAEKLKSGNARKSSDEDVQDVLDSLANPIRYGTVKLLNESVKSSFSEIRNRLRIDDPTKLSFHLRKLKSSGLLEQDGARIYYLSEKGKKVAEILSKLREV